MSPRPESLGARHADLVKALLRTPTWTRGELATRLGWSRATVSVRLDDLLQGEWAEVVDRVPAAGLGRPTERVRFRTEAALVLYVEVTPWQVRLALLRLDGRTVAMAESSGSTHDPLDDVLATITTLRADVVAGGVGPDATIVHCVVSVPSPIDELFRARNQSIHDSWRTTDVREAIERVVEAPTIVENDANLLAIGSAEPGETLLFVAVGDGIGTGLMVRGVLQRGAAGTAGEVGHLQVPGASTEHTSDYRCSCGRANCLSTMAAIPAIARALDPDCGRVRETPAGRMIGAGTLPRDTIAAAEREDGPRVDAAFRTAGEVIAVTLAPAVAVAAVDRVMITAWDADWDTALTLGLRSGFADALPHRTVGVVAPGERVTQRDPARLGAVVVALQHLLSDATR
jgi:predicted NBD/HSP70 family sugar kinase